MQCPYATEPMPAACIDPQVKSLPIPSSTNRSPRAQQERPLDDLRAITPRAKQINSKQVAQALYRHDPVLFNDPAFQRDVYAFFGITAQQDDPNRASSIASLLCDYARVPPPYYAKDDDLKVWKKLLQGDQVKNHNMPGSSE